MFKYLGVLLVCFLGSVVMAQETKKAEFSIVDESHTVTILIDKKDAKVVSIAATIFANDVSKVTGKKPVVGSKANNLVYAG